MAILRMQSAFIDFQSHAWPVILVDNRSKSIRDFGVE